MDSEDLISSLNKFAQLPSSLSWVDNIMRPFAGLEHISRLHDIGKTFQATSSLSETVLSAFRTSHIAQSAFGSIGTDLALIAAQARDINRAFKTTGLADSVAKLSAFQNVATDIGSKVASAYPASFFEAARVAGLAAGSIADLFPSQYVTSLQAFKVPSTVIDRLSQFESIQKSFFQDGGFNTLASTAVLAKPWLGQTATLQETLASLYGDLARAADSKEEWEELGLSADIGETALTFINSFVAGVTITKERLGSMLLWAQQMVVLLIVAPATTPSKRTQVFVFWFSILTAALGTYAYVEQKSQPEAATKKDLAKFTSNIARLIQVANKAAARTGIVYQVERAVQVHLKPNRRSLVIDKLSPNKVVMVLRKKGKWVYISFQDDNKEPVHGWALKKYLTAESALNNY
ncbi:SH3 domain-containing protein [Hymenobacter pini]|uniref:hypothetical protein n=1 Tax=Hymenobacter pini TaxID=2880879 RepID=UPI001CF2BF65|nr:hypothetical protein [Hymenobacter pini]MCA8831981.1 hypothetical protein [Hymenobacter pini]